MITFFPSPIFLFVSYLLLIKQCSLLATRMSESSTHFPACLIQTSVLKISEEAITREHRKPLCGSTWDSRKKNWVSTPCWVILKNFFMLFDLMHLQKCWAPTTWKVCKFSWWISLICCLLQYGQKTARARATFTKGKPQGCFPGHSKKAQNYSELSCLALLTQGTFTED